MDSLILILVALAVVIVTCLIFLNRSKQPKPAPARNQLVPQGDNAAANLPRNLQRNRMRNRNRLQNRAREDENEEQLDDLDDRIDNYLNNRDEDEDGDQMAEREDLRKKIGTKKLAKLEEKAARRERNEQMLREREERKALEEQRYQERKKKEEDEERLEKEREEAEKKVREEQEKRDYEEYLKLKEQFTVDEEGQDADLTEQDAENLLNQFVDFIKNSKIVVLEDLACEFKLKTQEVIDRINQVQEMGLLTGVMDDRGKFIYITEDELLKVKKFIEQRGRVNIIELAKSSNELVSLKPNNNEKNLEIESVA
ncbi:DDRGK domain-containing 1 [Brachionus plicatilis]|uniref:DDRGK domain-containing protein 1 n=1 Tax=Brachionus plicatilis TaxID=10195 RepID=A0A3M7SWW4_BRAPC|nr:DDRGK domain-containing 1 [Brachionus plicatilis]